MQYTASLSNYFDHLSLFCVERVQMNQVGLREVVKSEDDRRFEVTVTSKRGRAVEVWTMQAATRQLKTDWVARIKKLLMKQFFSIRRTCTLTECTWKIFRV